MPLECCSTASQHCSTASGLQQHCLWTAAALLLDSDTAFLLRQHCLQLVAALPSHESGSAFTMWQHCLQTVVPLPLECCMPLECCSTASQHCSTTQVRSGQVVPATTVRQPAKCVRRQDVWPNTRTRNTESRCRFRRNRDAQKGLQPVDEDYLTQRGLQLVGAHLVRQWCVCPSQAAPLTPGGAQGGWRRRQPA